MLEWVERVTPGARVASRTVRPLAGGNVARRVEQVTPEVETALDRIEQALAQLPG
ncbi:MAG: hypothetical protein ACRDOA_17825 [Streptosporangiaceae bacterium]